MKLLCGAWIPNIVWYLRDRSRRFSELKDDIGDASAKVLTAQLRRLERDGVLTRHVMPTSPPTVEYALTDLGRELLPALEAIVSVGERLKKRQAWASQADSGRAYQDHRIVIANLTARRVDEIGALFHLSDEGVVEQMLGFRVQGSVDRNNIADAHLRYGVRVMGKVQFFLDTIWKPMPICIVKLDVEGSQPP